MHLSVPASNRWRRSSLPTGGSLSGEDPSSGSAPDQRKKIIGFLMAETSENPSFRFSLKDIRSAEHIMLEKGRTGRYQPALFPPNEQSRLQTLQAYEVLDTEPEAGFDQIVGLASRIFRCPIALVSLVDLDRQFFKAECGLGSRQTGRDVSFCAYALKMQAGDLFVVRDATLDERFRYNTLVTGQPLIVFYAGAPLVSSDQGNVIGTLCIIDHRPRPDLTQDDLQVLTVLARQVMTELDLRKALRQSSNLRKGMTELINNVLPPPIASRLLDEPRVCDRVESCTVCFCDLSGFTEWASKQSDPSGVVSFLDALFTRFDLVVAAHGVCKIKTMGDGYLFVAGVPTPSSDHAEEAVKTAYRMIECLNEENARFKTNFSMRVGMATGSAVAGVVGSTRFAYDLWGATVNLASRVESNGTPGRVCVADSTAKALEHSEDIVITPAYVRDLKGLGPTQLYFADINYDG